MTTKDPAATQSFEQTIVLYMKDGSFLHFTREGSDKHYDWRNIAAAWMREVSFQVFTSEGGQDVTRPVLFAAMVRWNQLAGEHGFTDEQIRTMMKLLDLRFPLRDIIDPPP